MTNIDSNAAAAGAAAGETVTETIVETQGFFADCYDLCAKHPIITTTVAAAIVGTAGYQVYKYTKAPKLTTAAPILVDAGAVIETAKMAHAMGAGRAMLAIIGL